VSLHLGPQSTVTYPYASVQYQLRGSDLNSAIEAVELDKRFVTDGKKVSALNGLSIRIPQGGIFGILGQNGAGKSTLFRILIGLIKPDSGSVRVLERQPGIDASLCGDVGAMIETPHFFNFMTAEEILRMLAHLRGTRFAAAPRSLLARVGLASATDRKIRGFSVGMKQRLGIAAALVSRPKLVILDEPTSGMDPIGIQEIRHLVRELAVKDGITVIMASHQLEEVTKLSDHVAILHQGSLRALGSVFTLLQGHERLRLTVEPLEGALALLQNRAKRDGESILATIGREEAPQLIAAMVGAGIKIFEAAWIKPSLEEVFLSHVRS
jgi:ABC-2 type transport system ATP-binding protein